MTPRLLTARLAVTATLTFAPMVGLAQEQSAACKKAHANCQTGTVYDEKTETCVVVSS